MIRREHGPGGFTLIELLVGFTIMLGIFLVALTVFDVNSRVARVQTQLSEMQQSLRVAQFDMARMVRMAGRGGLPSAPVPATANPVSVGPAVAVRDNVGLAGDSTDVAVGFPASPTVVTGTDVLAIRGVFNSPIYQVNSTDPGSFVLFDAGGAPVEDPALAATGQVRITDPGPAGIPQDLTALADAIQDNVPEGIVLVSPIDDGVYAVVELNAGGSGVDDPDNPRDVTLAFNVTTGTHVSGYRTLYDAGGGNLPNGLTSAAFVGILEEYRYYIREAYAVAGDNTTPLRPKLSRARMFPGTETPHRSLLSEAQVDVADGIFSLQVALGFDSSLGEPLVDRDGDGQSTEDDIIITETDDGDADDWLFNGESDDVTASPWSPPWDAATPQPELYYVRISTLVRGEGAEQGYQAPILVGMENASLSQDPLSVLNQEEGRSYRRRLLETIVDMRNI